MLDRIIERLGALGYGYDSENDSVLLEYEAERGEAFILSACNLAFIPKVLEGVYIDIVCGYFLRKKLCSGVLTESEASGIVGKITEGDVSVEYASDKELSMYEKADRLISELLKNETELAAARKIKW